MGIQGLTTFVANNSRNLLENFSLQDCNLVIDGNSLSIQLYQHCAKCHSIFGGNYDVYFKFVKKFFGNVLKCNITPYVLIDGGYEDKKLKTVLKRLRCRIHEAANINPLNQSASLVIPVLLKDVFIEVLNSLKIKYVVCEFEADHEIAIVARFLECPVLSYDSDFYIYNVKYIPFPTLHLKPSSKKVNETLCYYLKCKIYKVENFAKYFKIKESVLPLIATLLGNDYVKRHVFSKFFHNLSESKSKKRNTGQCKISALIHWFKNETYESAVEKILDRFKLSRRKFIHLNILGSCRNYAIKHCESLEYFGLSSDSESKCTFELSESALGDTDEILDEAKSSDSESEEYSSSSDEFIPYANNELTSLTVNDWLKLILRSGKISPKFYDLIHKALYIGTPQVEDFSKIDSNLSSLPILIFSFNIVKGFKTPTFTYEGRKGLKYKRSEINAREDIKEIGPNWKTMDNRPTWDLFLYFLQRTIRKEIIDFILEMPADIQMIVITIYWIIGSNAERIEPKESHIATLILCYITMLLSKTHCNKEYTHFEFISKYSKSFKEWSTVNKSIAIDPNKDWQELKRNLSYEDSMLALSELLKFHDINKNMLSTPKLFRKENLHFFAEYQCCLQQIKYLNTLTSELLEPCVISETYNGTFIYNMYDNLRRRSNPTIYIIHLLNKSPCVLSYFLKIIQLFGYGVNILSTEVPRSSSKRKKKKKNTAEDAEDSEQESVDCSENENEDVCHVNNKFHLLTISN